MLVCICIHTDAHALTHHDPAEPCVHIDAGSADYCNDAYVMFDLALDVDDDNDDGIIEVILDNEINDKNFSVD